jgi:hypothetical protein
MASQSIPALLAKLIRLRTERARGLLPRPTFVVTLAVLPIVVALLWPPADTRIVIPTICVMGPDAGWRMAPAPADPIASLENAHARYGRANWESGEPAEPVTALFVILARPDARDALHEVLANANELEGQLYAACGLARLGDPEGVQILQRIADADRLVSTQSGCSRDIVPMRLLLTAPDDWRALEAAQHDPSRYDEMTRILMTEHNPPMTF